jgi:hypothetical protein
MLWGTATVNDRTHESVLLDQHPSVRELVPRLADFIAWESRLPIVDVDGERLYVIGGDQLKDRDQVIVSWVNEFRPDLFEGSPENAETPDQDQDARP